MKAYGAIFRGWEVRAFLDGTKTRYTVPMKTQPPASTRRMVPSQSTRHWLPVVPQVRGPLGCLGRGPLDIQGCGQPICVNGPIVGDRVWVKETWELIQIIEDTYCGGWDGDTWKGSIPKYRPNRCAIRYRATDDDPSEGSWRPSISLPRWASRLTLEVAELRMRRVQDMGPDDANAEGCPDELGGEYCVDGMDASVVWFMDHWDRRYLRKGLGWDRNPWVIVRDVRRVEESEP